MAREKPIKIYVDRTWFDGWFEPTRKKYENNFGINLSQQKFTEFLAKKNGVKKPRRVNIFKRLRRKRLII